MKPEKRSIFVSTLPYLDCTEAICELNDEADPVPTIIYAQHVSRHGRHGHVMDLDDVQGLLTFSQTGEGLVISKPTLAGHNEVFRYYER